MNLSSNNKHKTPDVVKTPSRFRNPIGKYRLDRTDACTSCGKCVEICPYGVHVMRRGKVFVKNHYLCVGEACPNPCYEACPEHALSIKRNPVFDTIGDYRWSADLLTSTWYMAETGDTPPKGMEYRTGA